jgi:Kelch motif
MNWRALLIVPALPVLACQGPGVPEGATTAEPGIAAARFQAFALVTETMAHGRSARLVATKDGVEAEALPSGKLSLKSRLPLKASERVRLEVSGHDIAVDFTLQGAASTLGETADGRMLFAAAGPNASDVLVSVHEQSVEDYVRFAEPGVTQLHYEMDVTRVAGLRLVANTLELLDRAAVPRLRVSPPYVVDTNGQARYARLSLEGCAYDTNPAIPQGRSLVAPSSASCSLLVDWDDSRLAYPVIVDPRWSTTALGLAQARVHHTATLIKADAGAGLAQRVCLIGGHEGHSLPIKAIECWVDSVWTTAGELQQERFDHAAAAFLSPKVLIVGGVGTAGPLRTWETYDVTSGLSQLGAEPLTVARKLHTATRLDSGDVVVLGGGSPLPLFFKDDGSVHPALGAQMVQPRFGHVAEVAAGKIFVFGGSATADMKQPLSSVGYFDPTKNVEAFTELPDVTMNTPRVGHSATRLPPLESAQNPMREQILVVGGNRDSELFDPADLTFSPTGTLTNLRRERHAAVPMPAENGDAQVLLVGGGADPYVWDQNEVYSAARGEWTVPQLLLSEKREAHTATLLEDGHTVVVAGGERSAGVLFSTTTDFALLYGPGEPCRDSTDCVAGVCTAGVCCNTECEGACEACTLAAGADSAGVCKTLDAGADCRGEPAACHERATCDGMSVACPSGEPSSDGTPCTQKDGASAICDAGACVEPPSEGGAGGGAGGQSPSMTAGEGGMPEVAGAAAGEGGSPPKNPHPAPTSSPIWLLAGLALLVGRSRRRFGGVHVAR